MSKKKGLDTLPQDGDGTEAKHTQYNHDDEKGFAGNRSVKVQLFKNQKHRAKDHKSAKA